LAIRLVFESLVGGSRWGGSAVLSKPFVFSVAGGCAPFFLGGSGSGVSGPTAWSDGCIVCL